MQDARRRDGPMVSGAVPKESCYVPTSLHIGFGDAPAPALAASKESRNYSAMWPSCRSRLGSFSSRRTGSCGVTELVRQAVDNANRANPPWRWMRTLAAPVDDV